MLTKIDYADHSIEHFTSQLPKETQFVALNTNVPHVLAESDYSHRVRELTVGIAFLSKILGENAGGPLLKLSSLNRLIAAVDPANPASKPVRLENIKMGALAAAAPDGSPKFPSIKAELAEPEPLGHQKIQEIVAAAKGDALRAGRCGLHIPVIFQPALEKTRARCIQLHCSRAHCIRSPGLHDALSTPQSPLARGRAPRPQLPALTLQVRPALRPADAQGQDEARVARRPPPQDAPPEDVELARAARRGGCRAGRLRALRCAPHPPPSRAAARVARPRTRP